MRDRMVRKALQIETKICVQVCVMCKNEMTGERTAKAPMALQGRKLSSEGLLRTQKESQWGSLTRWSGQGSGLVRT